jgi:hypothetical protein
MIIGAIEALAHAAKALFGYLKSREDNNPPVVVCKSCGYWEKIAA